MRILYLCIFVVSVLCVTLWYAQCYDDDEFVDPQDMLNYDPATQTMKKLFRNMLDSEPIENDRCTLFLSRFVNILLMNTGISNSNKVEDGKLKSYASVTLSAEDLQLLKNMILEKEIDFIEIDRILNDMFIPIINENSKFIEINSFIDNDQIKEVLFWILVATISIILLYIIFKNIYHPSSITFVIFVIFSLAFASTWYTMYMKAEINRSVHLEQMPPHCHSKTHNWLPFSWFKTSNLDECKKYKEAIYLNPKYSIAVTEVLAEMFTRILIKPIECLGESIYVFNKSVLKDFPILAQIILVPIIIIVVIKTLLLSCALLVGRSLSMKSIFGYGGTSIGQRPANNEKYESSNITNNDARPNNSAQYIDTRIPELPKFNFNINLFHPSSNIDHRNSRRDTSLSFNNDLISMLKNKDIDGVDSKGLNNEIEKKTET